MRRGEGIGHLGGALQRLTHRQRTTLEAGSEGFALDELHDQELDAFVLSDIMQRADVGMIQRRGGMGLALESLAAFETGRHMSRQAFERDDAIQPRVSRSVDLAHATDADEREDLVSDRGESQVASLADLRPPQPTRAARPSESRDRVVRETDQTESSASR